MTTENTDQIIQLDPAKVLATDNSRWGTKPRDTDVSRLMDSILEHGGVLEPVEVAELTADEKKANKGFTHSLTFGFNRHAAVTKLNAEQGAELTLPCIVRTTENAGERVKRQVAENNDRATLSPMDKAVAIKRLLDTGLIKADVRRIFSAAGGRKGSTVQPMSSAMLNILLNLLDLPKAIQEDIHAGVIGVEGAYVLGKVTPDKRQAVVDRAKKDRLAQIEQEEKDERKYLADEQKVVETEKKVQTAQEELDAARVAVTDAEALVKTRIEEMKSVKVAIAGMETPAGPAEVEASKAAEANVKAAQKVLKDARNAATKSATAKSTASEAVEAVKAKLEASRAAMKKGKAKTKGSIGKVAVSKAAQAVGTKAGAVALGVGDIRKDIKDMAAGKLDADDRLAQVAGWFLAWMNGGPTTKEMVVGVTALLDSFGAKLPVAAPKKDTPPAAPDVKQGPIGQKVKKVG